MKVLLVTSSLSNRSSHTLLRQGAGVYLDREPVTEPLAFGQWGKPYFPAFPQLHFSITHSGDTWMCAFGGAPLGLDYQVSRSCRKEALSRRFFNPLEQEYLKTHPDAFFPLWSAKESYIKYTGRGLSQGLPTFSLVDEKGTFPCFPGLHLSLLPAPLGHGLCLCTPQAVSQLAYFTLPGADGGKD